MYLYLLINTVLNVDVNTNNYIINVLLIRCYASVIYQYMSLNVGLYMLLAFHYTF